MPRLTTPETGTRYVKRYSSVHMGTRPSRSSLTAHHVSAVTKEDSNIHESKGSNLGRKTCKARYGRWNEDYVEIEGSDEHANNRIASSCCLAQGLVTGPSSWATASALGEEISRRGDMRVNVGN
ncbi:hypothetical protein BJX99DRAFT_230152 [Aspergillus californicus]